MARFNDKVALVTGGASGIGEATAQLLVSEGASVVIADVNDDLGSTVASRLGATFVHLDVTDSSAWSDVASSAPFDIAVLNAGVGARFHDLQEVDDQLFDTVIGVNVAGVFKGTRAMLGAMLGRGGAISVTSSMAGLAAHTQSPLYGMSKWATIGWIRAIAPSLSEHGVRINAVCPGLVDTPILGPGGGDMMRGMGMKVLDPAEVAEAHAVALSEPVTGIAYTVQAGLGIGIHEFAEPAGYQG